MVFIFIYLVLGFTGYSGEEDIVLGIVFYVIVLFLFFAFCFMRF